MIVFIGRKTSHYMQQCKDTSRVQQRNYYGHLITTRRVTILSIIVITTDYNYVLEKR